MQKILETQKVSVPAPTPLDEMKYQALRVKAKRGTIRSCKLKVLIQDSASDYLLWDDGKTVRESLVREEEANVIVWFAKRALSGEKKDESKVFLNTKSQMSFPVGISGTVNLDVWVIADNYTDKKPHQFDLPINTWGMLELKPPFIPSRSLFA
ncbi:MAG: hypothetical protein ABSF09_12270 [Candidatus Bathyarchaeia archaeon]|jgi:hypothetical protein